MKKLVNFRPIVFVTFGLIFGILICYFKFSENLFGLIVSAVCCALFFIVYTFFTVEKPKAAVRLLFVLLFFAAVIFGAVSFGNAVTVYNDAGVYGHELRVHGRVSEINCSDGYITVIIDKVSVSGVYNGGTDNKISAVIYGDSDVDLGDMIAFTGTLKDKNAFTNGKFNASQVAEKIKYSIQLESAEIEKTDDGTNAFLAVNKYFRDTLKNNMEDEEFSVAYAMLTGNSDYMSDETLASYRSAGVAHIFAVSGLHIGVLAAAVYFLLTKLKVNDKIAFIAAFIICLFYSGVCGFSASSLRAVIMFAVLNIAKRFGFKYDGLSSLFSGAFIILAISPAQLFCAGFGLSFSVVGTMIILVRPLTRAFGKLPEKLKNALAVSLAAEIGGIPAMVLHFGNFTIISVAVNILFIPIVSVVFILLLICTCFGGICFSSVFLFLPKYILIGLNYIFRLLDFRVFVIGGLTAGGFVVFYYAAIAVGGGLLNLKKVVCAVLTIVLAMTAILGTAFMTVDENRGIYLDATGSKNFSAVLLRREDKNLLIIADVANNFSVGRLKRAAAKTQGTVCVIVLNNGNKTDVQVVYSKLRGILNVKEFYYCGQKDEDSEFVLNREYGGLLVRNVGDGEEIRFFGDVFTLSGGGRCVSGKVAEKGIAVLSAFYEESDIKVISVSTDMILATDRLNSLTEEYSPKKIVSFRYASEFTEAESENFAIRIDKEL